MKIYVFIQDDFKRFQQKPISPYLLVIWHWKRSDLGLSLTTGKSAWRGENRRCINAFRSSFWEEEAQAHVSVRKRFEEYFFHRGTRRIISDKHLCPEMHAMVKMRSIPSGFWINSWFCLLYNVSWLTETEMFSRVLGLILLRDPTLIWWIIVTWPQCYPCVLQRQRVCPFLKTVLNVILQPSI